MRLCQSWPCTRYLDSDYRAEDLNTTIELTVIRAFIALAFTLSRKDTENVDSVDFYQITGNINAAKQTVESAYV